MKVHELKTWPPQFNAIIEGRKTAEFRKNDRDFEVDDLLILREWYPPGYDVKPPYSRQYIVAIIKQMESGGFGIPEGYVVMSIETITKVNRGLFSDD